MNPLVITYALDGLLMIALPVLLGAVLARRLGVRWSLFGVGAATFVISQVVHRTASITRGEHSPASLTQSVIASRPQGGEAISLGQEIASDAFGVLAMTTGN